MRPLAPISLRPIAPRRRAAVDPAVSWATLFATDIREAQRDWRRLRLTLRAARLRRRFGIAPPARRASAAYAVPMGPLRGNALAPFYGGHMLEMYTRQCVLCDATEEDIAARVFGGRVHACPRAV